MIVCSPKIVINPTPTTGLPANSLPGSSPDNPFSAALQAATQSLLHPSPKSAKPGQLISSTSTLKTGSASANPPLQHPNQAATNPITENNTLSVQGLGVSAAPLVPAAAPPPATVDEAKLQAATLGAEQNQSALQIARVGTAAISAQAIPSAATGFPQGMPVSPQFPSGTTDIGAEQNQSAVQIASVGTVGISAQAMPSATTGFPQGVPVSPQFPSGTTDIAGGSPAILPGPQTTASSSALPELLQVNTAGTAPNSSRQPNPQPLDGLDLVPVAAGTKETAPVQTESPTASSTLANQLELPAHSTKPASQPVPATAQPAGNATPPANAMRPAPSQPEHSGGSVESKNQTPESAGAPAVVDSSAPQVPLQLVVPDLNVMKATPQPADALQTAPALTGSSSADVAPPATEISNKNGDGSGSGSTQSGNGSTPSIAPMAATSQTADASAVPTTKLDDVSASPAVGGTQAAHPVVSVNDAPGTSAKTDASTAEGLHSPATGTTETDARVQAAASYANSLLHSARLVERVGQSELRVGIQAGEFGNVDIRTSMVRNQFTAQISVERGELGKVLASELPSLQNKLSEQRLPGANIILQNHSSGGSAGFGQGSRQSQTMQQIVIPQRSEGEPAPAFMGLADASASTERLDVHM